ncbi:MAG: TadE/TadG family type IV pilus assembly protein [Terriglobia bacterium]
MLEAALVIPLLAAFILAIFWFGRAYNIYQTATRAAREGARAAVAPTCATCGNTSLSSAQVQLVVNQALSADGLDPSKVTSFQALANQPVAGSMTCPASPQVLSSGQICGAVVSFTYPFTFSLPLTAINVVNISAHVQMEEENP